MKITTESTVAAVVFLLLFLAVGGTIAGCLRHGCECRGPGVHIIVGEQK